MYKERLEGFPEEIVEKMLDHQVEQGNPRNIAVFERNASSNRTHEGFDWEKTKENHNFWDKIIHGHDFTHFFNLYPKKEREIVGYKLKPECEKYSKYARILGIVGCKEDIETLTEAKVLDLWFEPVYKEGEEKEEPKLNSEFLKYKLEEIQLQITNLLKTL